MITIRPYEERDIENILTLQTKLYPNTRWSERWFRWKHEDNPHGKSIFMLAENDAGDLVGMRGLWPRRYSFDGKVWIAYQPTDTGVLADYRGQGLFKELTRQALALAVKAGGTLIFNFPNPASLPGYLRMGWMLQRRLHWWVRPWPIALARSRMTLETATESRSTPEQIRLVKDAEYVDWRYRRHPDKHYEFLQIDTWDGEPIEVVFAGVRRRGIAQDVLIDLVGLNSSAGDLRTLLGSIVRRVTRPGRLFTVLESTFGYDEELLRLYGFMTLPSVGINYVSYDNLTDGLVRTHDVHVCPGDIDTF